MAKRNLLHKNRVEEFGEWCESMGYVTGIPNGRWQLLRVDYPNASSPSYLYGRAHMSEHVTVPTALVSLVERFVKETRLGQ